MKGGSNRDCFFAFMDLLSFMPALNAGFFVAFFQTVWYNVVTLDFLI